MQILYYVHKNEMGFIHNLENFSKIIPVILRAYRPTRKAGPRQVGAPGRLILWHPFEPILFKLFWHRTAHAQTMDNFQTNSFACGYLN